MARVPFSLLTWPLLKGYSDLGRSDIPPRPQGVAMVDRDDGATYYITADSAGEVTLAALPSDWYDPVYGPHAGPHLRVGTDVYRLYSSNGTLQSEKISKGAGDFQVYDHAIFTVRTLPDAIYQLVAAYEDAPTGDIRVTDDGDFRMVSTSPEVYRGFDSDDFEFLQAGDITFVLQQVYP